MNLCHSYSDLSTDNLITLQFKILVRLHLALLCSLVFICVCCIVSLQQRVFVLDLQNCIVRWINDVKKGFRDLQLEVLPLGLGFRVKVRVRVLKIF